MDLTALTIDLAYMLVYALGQFVIFVGAAVVTAGFFTALTIVTVGLVRGRAASG